MYLSVAVGPHPCSCQLLSVSHSSVRLDYQLQGFLGEGRLHLGLPGAEELGGSLGGCSLGLDLPCTDSQCDLTRGSAGLTGQRVQLGGG